MTHEAAPLDVVVALQVWADDPDPSTNVTVRPPIPVPITGSSVVRTPETVSGWPFWAMVPPV